ncbi:hypothetical protein NGA_0333100 [Nannochloropsis gaditana CCMP526]|uniref:Uncharacterized protein n=1 Tax=Nannochloropsis gaditana TaxID=72520 RepID=W7TQQ1_9STRA|nr:hypothetical protein NGA_0333100 [Nannochloropsis gaditana CCMP526]EKU20247.1 hypothetical protein NGA_0333100 [Nannochloropsis gaditana CCMP526]EWM25878.1 hypothetical protein Naga_100054g33 [Nannochloropsis gaditana]|eukprot:XP_005856111.1 hypothetical protein NGA_0333100 [Nannochloropsis gaditana CCMP526]
MGSLFSRITNPRRYREHYENEETSTPAGGSNSAAAATSPVAETVEEAAPFDYMPLPKERVATIKGIFGFGQWQGVSIIEWFFVLFYSMVGVIMFLSIVQAMTMGSAGLAILYMVLSPIFFVLLTMAARVFTELVISVLMVPHLLMKNQQELQRQIGILQQQQQSYLSSTQQQQQQQAGCPDLEAGHQDFTTVHLHSATGEGGREGPSSSNPSSSAVPSRRHVGENRGEEIGIAMA